MKSRYGFVAGFVATLLLLVAGCGGHKGVTPVRSTADSHQCDINDYFMQCALPKTQKLTPPNGATVTARGIDFGWSCPSSTALNFGASYLSVDPKKNWTRACVARWPHQVFVWETSATRALSGFAAGVADARQANAQEQALGVGAVHTEFAVDFDATPAEQAAIDSYFKGADSVLGVARVGDYGGYWPTTRLCAAHLVTLSWQTYAWSGGHWAPASCAPLEQYLNDNTVDFDRAIAVNYGQHPTPVPPKPPAPPAPPKPPAPSFNSQWVPGFQRGFIVHWDRLHYYRVPPLGRVNITPVWRAGYNVGYEAAKR